MSKKDNKERKPEFEGQRDGEELLFVFRRHPIALRKAYYLLLVPLVIGCVPPLIWQTNLMLFWLPVIGLLIGSVLFAFHFIMWYFTIYIVTDQRVRQITQKGFFGKDVVELRLSKIQNISYNIPGFWGETIGFGTIVIQTYVGDLVIHNVGRPDDTYNKLQDAVSAVINKQEEHEEANSI